MDGVNLNLFRSTLFMGSRLLHLKCLFPLLPQYMECSIDIHTRRRAKNYWVCSPYVSGKIFIFSIQELWRDPKRQKVRYYKVRYSTVPVRLPGREWWRASPPCHRWIWFLPLCPRSCLAATCTQQILNPSVLRIRIHNPMLFRLL